MSSWEEAYHQYQAMEDPLERWYLYNSLEFSQAEPLEDVYEAALLLCRHDDDSLFYRGQRRADWGISPSLFRDDAGPKDEELAKLSSLVRYLQSELQIPQKEALAVAQHYSSVPDDFKVRSWVLDVTTDPRIACFFASLRGEPGDVGTVYKFKPHEMERLRTETPKQVGEVDVIEPPDVPRIDRQHATFIDHSHPELLQGYLPLNTKFQQKGDHHFEDPDLNITEDDLFPSEDEYRDLVHKWANTVWPEDVPPSKLVTPNHNPMDPMEVSDYLAMVKEWLQEMGISYENLSDAEQRCLQDLCRIHHKIRNHDKTTMLVKSEHLLRQTLSSIIAYARSEGRPLEFDDVVERYWNESSDLREDRKVIQEIIREVRPEYNFDRSWTNRW